MRASPSAPPPRPALVARVLASRPRVARPGAHACEIEGLCSSRKFDSHPVSPRPHTLTKTRRAPPSRRAACTEYARPRFHSLCCAAGTAARASRSPCSPRPGDVDRRSRPPRPRLGTTLASDPIHNHNAALHFGTCRAPQPCHPPARWISPRWISPLALAVCSPVASDERDPRPPRARDPPPH